MEMARQKRISYFNEILLKLFLIKLALSPTNTYINDFFACFTTRLGNPNPLRERQRETEIVLLGQQRESLRETGVVFECKPHWILHRISAGVLDTVSTIIMGWDRLFFFLRTNFDFRIPNRVMPGEEDEEENNVTTMSRKRRWPLTRQNQRSS